MTLAEKEMVHVLSDDPIMYRPAKVVGKFAPYWENDQTVNPIMVMALERPTGEFFNVKLPDGTEKYVHCHTLGAFR
jgi:hypothetical protein